MDFPDPKDYNVSKLYSLEFYQFIKKNLSDDGFACFDAPGLRINHFVNKETITSSIIPHGLWEIYKSTLTTAGFETVIPYVSNLEGDNPQAYKILKKNLPLLEKEWKKYLNIRTVESASGITDEDRLIKKLIASHIGRMKNGFIMIKTNSNRVHFNYNDFKVKHHVLNKDRFKIAFSYNANNLDIFNPEKVNSIMKPTLPYSPTWWFRLGPIY